MTTSSRRRWADLPPPARAGLVALTGVQLGLLAAALTDLRSRDATELTAPRWVWALACGVNIVGPLTYFAAGRRRSGGAG